LEKLSVTADVKLIDAIVMIAANKYGSLMLIFLPCNALLIDAMAQFDFIDLVNQKYKIVVRPLLC
jgi:hypothetical protein